MYEPRVRREGLDSPPSYRELVQGERRLLESLAEELRAIDGAAYVDVLRPMQEAAMGNQLYPRSRNGHPIAAGYDVIAAALAPVVGERLPPRPCGLLAIDGSGGRRFVLARDGGYRVFRDDELVSANGWAETDDELEVSPPRSIATLEFRGFIDSVDPARYGPEALEVSE